MHNYALVDAPELLCHYNMHDGPLMARALMFIAACIDNNTIEPEIISIQYKLVIL
jgi:hypothetical protein